MRNTAGGSSSCRCRGLRRPHLRHLRGSAAARRGGREVDDLPADGDLVRGRRGHVPADLQLPARRGSGRTSASSTASWSGLGNKPVAWLSQGEPWNNAYLMVIMVWMQTGRLAMVVLSAAIKAIPAEIIEAARIDGASEWQIFRHVGRDPEHPPDDRRRRDVHGHQRPEGVRHRLRDGQRRDRISTEVIAERMIRLVLHQRTTTAAVRRSPWSCSSRSSRS